LRIVSVSTYFESKARNNERVKCETEKRHKLGMGNERVVKKNKRSLGVSSLRVFSHLFLQAKNHPPSTTALLVTPPTSYAALSSPATMRGGGMLIRLSKRA
jgi:hypothetical protein